jgi:cytochrome c553
MKRISFRLALRSALLVLAFGTAGHAADDGNPIASNQGLQAKLEYCKTCHGQSGQGYFGYFAMPRLAGQQTAYLENQLRAFSERRRANAVMHGAVRGLSRSTMAALAAHFQDLNPKPLGGAPRERVGEGKAIYQEGLPEANVPACSACHGVEAKGQNEIPRLAGQLFPYLVKELTNWTKERGQGPSQPDTSTIMVPTAHNLSRSQISAVAAYVSNLR